MKRNILEQEAEVIAKLEYGLYTGQIDEVTAGTAMEAEFALLLQKYGQDEDFDWGLLDDLVQEKLRIYKMN